VGVAFALVSGAWHGAWSWERLLEPLRERGQRAVAVDLPSEDPDAGLEANADAIASQLSQHDDVVVVAHSASGVLAPLVAARRPVRGIVYLSAFVPVPGQSMADQFAASPEPVLLLEGKRETDEIGRSQWTDFETTARVLYPDLSDADARWAFARLRPQAQRTQLEPHPTGLPEVPIASVVCSRDRVVNPAWSRRIARERLGMQAVELPTGHFPMITDPATLAEALIAQAP
jgi:pimeloyl-ACP methyl ester carboxylesterase